jgi:hypothetical protein
LRLWQLPRGLRHFVDSGRLSGRKESRKPGKGRRLRHGAAVLFVASCAAFAAQPLQFVSIPAIRGLKNRISIRWKTSPSMPLNHPAKLLLDLRFQQKSAPAAATWNTSSRRLSGNPAGTTRRRALRPHRTTDLLRSLNAKCPYGIVDFRFASPPPMTSPRSGQPHLLNAKC